MKHEQTKYLKTKLSKLLNDKHRASWKEKAPVMPATVRMADQVVRRWKQEQSDKVDRQRRTIERAYNKAYQVILFGEPLDALKALKEFEKFKS